MIEAAMYGFLLMFIGAMAFAVIVGIITETCGFIAWFARIIATLAAALARGLWRGAAWLLRMCSRAAAC